MRILPVSNSNAGFKHKILIDIGASNPKGTLKITVLSDFGNAILKESGPNSYLNNTVKGFEGPGDFIEKVAKVIKRTYDRVLLKDKSGEFPLIGKDKLLSGIAIFVPGTTYTLGKMKDLIDFMPNLRDKKNKALKKIDFSQYAKDLKTKSKKETGIDVNKKEFNFVVTKDLGGTGVGLAKLLAKRDMLQDAKYYMGIMTGGGFGSVDLKVFDGKVHFETSESSSYIAGNYEAYDKIAGLLKEVMRSRNPKKKIEELTSNNNSGIKKRIPIHGKLGRQGVNVKSHIGTFCTEIGRPDLFPLLRAVGDARIVEMNRMCVSEKDNELIDKIRSMPDIFREIESTTDGKIAFEIVEETFGKQVLKRARTVAVNEYADAISIIANNKIADNLNTIVLLGPFAHGVNHYVKTHSGDFGGAKDLPELIKRKVIERIKKVDLPSIEGLRELYKFKVICDKDINFSDNTFAGSLFLDPECKFVPERGGWFSIPIETLKNA